jgi:hypothetical protein
LSFRRGGDFGLKKYIKNPDYSKKNFLKTFLNKRDEILNGQESYLKEEEKKKQDELEKLRQ